MRNVASLHAKATDDFLDDFSLKHRRGVALQQLTLPDKKRAGSNFAKPLRLSVSHAARTPAIP